MELLIDLVEKRKLTINDISLAAVTDEYVEYVNSLKERLLPETSKFVALAATLLLIKSKSLLPILELTDEETEDIENLEERLKLYQLYRTAGISLATVFGRRLMHERVVVSDRQPLFVTDKFTTVLDLSDALSGLISNLPKKQLLPEVEVKPIILLEEMIDRLLERVTRQVKSTLRELTAGDNQRATVIVGFLAVLELVKQGHVEVERTARFEDIEIRNSI